MHSCTGNVAITNIQNLLCSYQNLVLASCNAALYNSQRGQAQKDLFVGEKNYKIVKLFCDPLRLFTSNPFAKERKTRSKCSCDTDLQKKKQKK